MTLSETEDTGNWKVGQNSAVVIATRYELGGPGIESRWGAECYARVQTGSGTHTASYTMGTGPLSRGLGGRGVALTTHPRLVPRLKKE